MLYGAFNGFWNSESFGDNPRIADQYPFQSAAFGNYYLSDYAIHQNFFVSWAQIDPGLAAEMANKTTTAPLELPAELALSQPLTLMAQTLRYSSPSMDGTQHIGFHYEALDYIVADVWLQPGAVLNVLPGTAIGMRDDYWNGFSANVGSVVNVQGRPDKPVTFTQASLVQEQPSSPWFRLVQNGNGDWNLFPLIFFNPRPSGLNTATGETFAFQDFPPAAMNFRFAHFYMAGNNLHIAAGKEPAYTFSLTSWLNLTLQDCELHDGGVVLGEPIEGGGPCALSWVNNLFDRVQIVVDPSADNIDANGVPYVDMAFQAYNNLFRGGTLDLEPIPASAGYWIFMDNLLDKAPVFQETTTTQNLTYDHNAYWPLTADELAIWSGSYGNGFMPPALGNGTHDVVLPSAPAYQTGPYGNYYLANTAQLYGTGSRTPAAAGLFHYTTRPDQVKEGNEPSGHQVNIGLHYIANLGSGAQDSDNDGIPDYVEDANGNGAVDPAETDWRTAWTTPGVFDPTNAVYDDVDLSGSGLVGRIKKALGMNALDVSNPLAITQVITEEEPQLATFTLPINYNLLTNIGTVNLFMDGTGVNMDAFTNNTDGSTQVIWNTTFEPGGTHLLREEITLNGSGTRSTILTGCGPILPFFSSNIIQFYEADGVFTSQIAYLDAELSIPNANYTIDIYDTSTTPKTLVSRRNNSTYDGLIQEDWGVTNADGTPFAGHEVEAAYTLTPIDENGAPIAPAQSYTRYLSWVGSPVDIPYFDFSYMYTCPNSEMLPAFADYGAIWYDMLDGPVDVLIDPNVGYTPYYTTFNEIDSPGTLIGYPGYVERPADVPSLYASLGDGLTRNFYCYAHGTPSTLADHYDVCELTVKNVANKLNNLYDPRKGVKSLTTPYRFVFLDACSSAATSDWRHAFGILRAGPSMVTRYALGPQAFVGWQGNTADWMGGVTSDPRFGYPYYNPALDTLIAESYTDTLEKFFEDWMQGKSLYVCIADCSNTAGGAVPFPVESIDEFAFQPYGPAATGYFLQIPYRSRLVVVGHTGLTAYGIDPNYEGR